jgi:hypothetical protein
MDIVEIEKDLQRRIDQSREWLSGKPAPITGLKVRDYSCLAIPISFHDHRKTSGVRFRIEFTTEQAKREVYVDIDIMPIRSVPTDEEKKPGAPFVDGFVVCDPKTKKRDLIAYDPITNTTYYERTIDLSIEEWYKGWLFKTLIHKGVSKIFKYAVEVKINH